MRILPLAALLTIIAPAVLAQTPARAPKPRVVAPITLSPAPRLTPDSEARWVPFELTPGNQIAFDMTVNGRTARAVLDTGVNFTLASRPFANVLGLKPAATAQAAAIGGALAIAWAPVESVGFGGLARGGGRVGVADLTALATGTAKPIDMIVGADLLALHALDVDFDGRRFRLLPSGRMPFSGAIVPIATVQQSGVFVVAATIGAATLQPLLVDTGDGSAVTVSRDAWASTRLPAVALTSASAVGLAGPIETDLTVLPAVRLGPLTARNIELRIERAGGYSVATGTAGRIGTGLLSRYRMLLDPAARRMILAPGKLADAMPLKSTSGLLLTLEGRALRVIHVMRNSPAAAAGWAAGERICRIDGAPIAADYRSSSVSQWPAGAPGRTVALGLCDGADRALTLAAFY